MKKIYLLFAVIFFTGIQKLSAQFNLTVAKDGSGNHTTVQAAINAAPTNSATPYRIFIKNGKYSEKITIPSNKPNIQLIGESVANVILTWDDYANKLTSCGVTTGTQNSASFTVNATDFVAINITFENSHVYGTPDNNGQQAVALLVNADRAAFKNCRFLGMQDTLYLKGSGTPRAYFKNCYIDGITDFIFGSSIALFDSCVVYAKTRTGISASWITAPNTPNGQPYGYVFRDARLPQNTGTTSYSLSRPWPSPTVADTRQKCVFLASKMGSHIAPAGWSTWDVNTVTANLYYGEYASKFFNGTNVDVSQRVNWSYQLSQADSATYTMSNVLSANNTLTAWNPCTAITDFCTNNQTDIAVSNFRVVKGASSSQFDWNISWPLNGIQYTLFRSSDNVSFSQVYSVTSSNDTAINFNYTDNTLPASGSRFYYYIQASKAGFASHITDTLVVSNAAELTVAAPESLSYCSFSQVVGTPSPAQTFTIAATNLTGNITITPPASYQVSSNNTTWFTNASPLTITPSSGTVATTTIYVRLNAASAGTYSGNVINASAGATTFNIAVTGTAANAPSISSNVIQQWPLTVAGTDSAAVRSAFVAAGSAPVLNRLTLSNGTQVAAVAQYTPTYGMAFGASTNGDGTWTTAVGGPGGNLLRTHYVQFTVTASGRSVRVDSLLVNSAFYNTNSNTRLAVVYSISGFTTDSANVTGGVDQTGAAVTGSFATPIALANQGSTGPTNQYRLALNGLTGITLTDGQSLTIRLYFSCSSTSAARYGMLRNVTVKGEALSPLPVTLLKLEATTTGKTNTVRWQTTREENLSHFILEKSVNGTEFSALETVKAGNANGIYSSIDARPFQGINYYRLKMVDRDGSFSYSSIVSVNTGNLQQVSLLTNPVKDRVMLSHDKAGNNATVEIFSADGRRLVSRKAAAGAVRTDVDFSAYGSGVYFLQYTDGGNRYSISFVK